MSSLTALEKRYFEDLFMMASGYVLEFTNARFAEFFRECVDIDIYTDKYCFNGDSKAKRLRAFWEVESDPLVGKVLSSLLDVWEYENPTDSKNSKYEQCRKIVERLLGKRSEKESTENEFLKKNFGNICVTKLKMESQLRPIIESRLKEACRCLDGNAPLATIFLCGSILEGILLGLAQQNPAKFNQSSSSPKDDNGKVKPFHKWTLNDFINVSNDVGFLGLDVKKFSHALRDFRNYIHPHQQMVTQFNPDKHTAEICLQVLKAAIADLSKDKP